MDWSTHQAYCSTCREKVGFTTRMTTRTTENVTYPVKVAICNRCGEVATFKPYQEEERRSYAKAYLNEQYGIEKQDAIYSIEDGWDFDDDGCHIPYVLMFATLEQARAYANRRLELSGDVLAITTDGGFVQDHTPCEKCGCYIDDFDAQHACPACARLY